ncbi:MAG: hypothetical protein M0Z69_10545 [Actinomycetota bacterium]|nr:hypothetical protein [Actinomycetota bacterium]
MATTKYSRPVALAIGLAASAAAALAIAVPASASGTPGAKPTQLILKATRASIAPKHKMSLTATLKSGHQGLANEQTCLQNRTKTSTGSWGPWGACMNLALTDANGQVQVTGVVPRNGKGTKEQFEVMFPGVSGQYKPSHSAIITVTTS